MFNAPTTYENLNKILRAMQIEKPILIEGSPGAGKTTLLKALSGKMRRDKSLKASTFTLTLSISFV